MLVKDDDELVSESETPIYCKQTFTSISALLYVFVIYFELNVVLPIIRQTRGCIMYLILPIKEIPTPAANQQVID